MWPRPKRRRRILETARTHERQALSPGLDAFLAAQSAVRPRRRAPLPKLSLDLGSWRTHPARLASLALAGAVGATLVVAALSGRFVVRVAEVVGNRRVPADLIRAAGGVDGRNAFGVDPAAAARRVAMLGDVRRASVHLRLPNRAVIRVEETAPVLAWEGPAGTLVVDEQGRVIDAPADTPGLVRVRDATGAVPPGGGAMSVAMVDAARAFGAQFGALTYDAATGYGAVTPAGWPVRLGRDPALIPRQAATLAALTARLAAGHSVEVVDLRFTEGSYYRLKEERR